MDPRTRTFMPSWGRNLISRAAVFHTTARTWALASLSEKYQCPEAGKFVLETSPSTHTSKNSVSIKPCRRSVSWLTVQARGRDGRLGTSAPKSRPFCSTDGIVRPVPARPESGDGADVCVDVELVADGGSLSVDHIELQRRADRTVRVADGQDVV